MEALTRLYHNYSMEASELRENLRRAEHRMAASRTLLAVFDKLPEDEEGPTHE